MQKNPITDQTLLLICLWGLGYCNSIADLTLPKSCDLYAVSNVLNIHGQ